MEKQAVLSQTGLMLLALQPLFLAILFICEILRNAPSALWVSFMAFSSLPSKMESQLLTTSEEKRIPWPRGPITPWPRGPMAPSTSLRVCVHLDVCAPVHMLKNAGSKGLVCSQTSQLHNFIIREDANVP